MSKRFALITDGVVSNIVEQEVTPPAVFNPVESNTAQIGDLFDGTSFSKPAEQPPEPLAGNALVLSQIAAIESQITARRIRESVLGVDGGWLSDADARIVALRASLA